MIILLAMLVSGELSARPKDALTFACTVSIGRSEWAVGGLGCALGRRPLLLLGRQSRRHRFHFLLLFLIQFQRLLADIKWLPWQDTSKDFLLALHPPYSVVLWNADTGEKIWKKSYTEMLHSLSLDPFNMRKLACTYNLLLLTSACYPNLNISHHYI